MNKMIRAIITGAESEGLAKAKLIEGAKKFQLVGILDGREITVFGIAKTPGRGGDEKLAWKKARDTMKSLKASGASQTYWNS